MSPLIFVLFSIRVSEATAPKVSPETAKSLQQIIDESLGEDKVFVFSVDNKLISEDKIEC